MPSPGKSLPRATELAHRLHRERLSSGDRAIDATVGNGHDTLFLANCVGPEGKVFGFDIQPIAIERTTERTAGLSQVELHCLGHEHLGKIVTEPVRGILFNLGYLPSGDKAIITEADTTLVALDTAIALLEPGGLLTVALYGGHEGGAEESEAVLAWASRLDQSACYAAHYGFLNLRNSPPSLLAVERRPEPTR